LYFSSTKMSGLGLFRAVRGFGRAGSGLAAFSGKSAARFQTGIVKRSFHKSSIAQGAGKCAGKEYNYFKVPHVSPVHYWGGEIMMTIMWLWIFYRAKKDL